MKINWSYFTKQRGIVIVSLVMCLVILGSANYIYTRSQNKVPDIPSAQEPADGKGGTTDPDDSKVSTPDGDDNKTVSAQPNYFEAYRTNRQSIRDMEMRYVQTNSDNQGSDEAVKKEAEQRLLEIASLMEKELKLESLIKSKGFEDVIAFVEDGSVNIVVKAEKLTSAQATKILKLVVDETGEASQNVTIITRV